MMDIIVYVFFIILIIAALVFIICFVVGSEFSNIPFIYQWFTRRRNLYKVGFNDGLNNKTIKKYDLERDRRIREIENKMYRAQKRFDEFYLNVQKEKLQRDEN